MNYLTAEQRAELARRKAETEKREREQLRAQAQALADAHLWLRRNGIRTLNVEPSDYRDTPRDGADAEC